MLQGPGGGGGVPVLNRKRSASRPTGSAKVPKRSFEGKDYGRSG